MALCWKCREYFVNKYGSNYYQPPSSHCHHLEPEEKLKEKCWCDYPEKERWGYIYTLISKENKRPVEANMQSWKNCPKCGKPLK